MTSEDIKTQDSKGIILLHEKRDCLLETGPGMGGGGGGRVKAPLQAPTRKTKDAVDRRQNNKNVKAVSPRHCAATSVLRN